MKVQGWGSCSRCPAQGEALPGIPSELTCSISQLPAQSNPLFGWCKSLGPPELCHKCAVKRIHISTISCNAAMTTRYVTRSCAIRVQPGGGGISWHCRMQEGRWNWVEGGRSGRQGSLGSESSNYAGSKPVPGPCDLDLGCCGLLRLPPAK